MEKQKNQAAVELGRLGGKIGGKSKSPAKLKAIEENGKKGLEAIKRKREEKQNEERPI